MSEFTQEISELGTGIWAYLFGSKPAKQTAVDFNKYLPAVKTFLESPAVVEQLAAQGLKVSPAFSALTPVTSALESQIKQLKFLLASAPMIDAPGRIDAREFFRRSSSPFGYIHPKTMARYGNPLDKTPNGVMAMAGSPTKWVLMSTMPEGRVIFSPFAVPGIENILAQ